MIENFLLNAFLIPVVHVYLVPRYEGISAEIADEAGIENKNTSRK